MSLSRDQINYLRFHASSLTGPGGVPESCAGGLLGVQSQIFTAASLAIAARTDWGTHADLVQRFRGERTLVKTWGQRNTVHLYASLSLPLMANAFRGEPSWSQRKYIKQGGTAQGFRDLIVAGADFLHEKGSCTRAEMSTYLAQRDPDFAGISSWGGILVDLGKRGHLCLGGYDKEAGAQLLYSTRKWHDMLSDPLVSDDGFEANRNLMEMYFNAYGPATLADFCHWRGVPLKKARAWMEGHHLDSLMAHQFQLDGETYCYNHLVAESVLQNKPQTADLPPLLLYRFDPLVLAHKDKSWLVQERDYKKVWRIAAHVEGVLLKKGRIVGVWKFERKGKRLRYIIHHFRTRDRIGKRDLEKRLHRISSYLGYQDWEWVEQAY